MKTLVLMLRRYQLPAILCAACAILGVGNPSFFSLINLRNILLQASVSGTLAVGMTYVIIVGGIDLSVGSSVALTGMLAALALHAHLPLIFVIALSLCCGAVIGWTNGILTQLWAIPPFIVTLGMMSALRGLALMLTDGRSISGFPNSFLWIGNGAIVGLPNPVLITVLVTVILGLYLWRSIGGIRLYAIGGNPQAAVIAGLSVRKYIVMTYVVSGLASSIGALVLTSRLNAALPTSGTGYELDAIAAAVIGGASLAGGYGSVFGTLLGALLVATLRNGLSVNNVSSYLQQVVIGVVIIGSVALNKSFKHS